MITIFVLCNNETKKIFRKLFVAFLKKRGKKISEVFISSGTDLLLRNECIKCEILIIYSFNIIYDLDFVDVVLILKNDLIDIEKINLFNKVVIGFNIESNINDNAKLINIGFSKSSTILITSMNSNDNGEVELLFTVQDQIYDYYGKELWMQEFKDKYNCDIYDGYNYCLSVLSVLKKYISII